MSTEWNAGYVTDINYTSGYYAELNPLRTRLPLLLAGCEAARVETACELGFGQGLSVAMHAAAQPGVSWYGTDFNPSQAAFATDLVRLSGVEAKLYEEAFAEFCNRPDLPDFDFIGLHGIWSWVSDENRHVLVDFVRRKLKPGGVLYVSYNTLPGWSASAPLRHLMKRHAEVLSPPGQGLVGRTDSAIGYIDQFLALDPLYVRANPTVVERLKQIKTQNRTYVAHEFMNRDWSPMYFADFESWISKAKVGYAASANTLESLPELNMTAQQAEFVRAAPDSSLRETLRDFCINQQFRRDYWVKGVRQIGGQRQANALRDERVVLAVARDNFPTKVRGAITEAQLNEGIYAPISELLADNKARSVGEIADAVEGKGVAFGHLRSALAVLFGTGVLQPAVASQDVEKAMPHTKALNRAIATRSCTEGDIANLASPVIGGGIGATRFHQLFWLSKEAGGGGHEAWADFAWAQLQAQGQTLTKEGDRLSPEAARAELKEQAQKWGEQVLPLWTALGI